MVEQERMIKEETVVNTDTVVTPKALRQKKGGGAWWVKDIVSAPPAKTEMRQGTE